MHFAQLDKAYKAIRASVAVTLCCGGELILREHCERMHSTQASLQSDAATRQSTGLYQLKPRRLKSHIWLHKPDHKVLNQYINNKNEQSRT